MYKKSLPAYTFIGSVGTELFDEVFAGDGFNATRTWVLERRHRSLNGEDSDALALAADKGRWGDTALDRRYFSCPTGLYCRDDDKFYTTGTPEFEKLKGVMSFKHFPHAVWTEDRKTEQWDKLLDAQKFTAEEKDMTQVICGRCLYKVGEKDNWQIAGFLKGAGGSGKSAVLNVVANFLPTKLVAYLESEARNGVGQHMHLIGSALVLCTDTSKVIGADGFRETWNKMVEGASVTLQRLRKSVWQGPWPAHLLHAGNHFFAWNDEQGQTKRRVLVVGPWHKVSESKADTNLHKKLEKEELMILAKCNASYTKLVTEIGDRTFHTVLKDKCPRFHQLGEQLSEETNLIMQFLKVCVKPVDDEKDKDTVGFTYSEFHQKFSNWCQDARPSAKRKNPKFDELQSQVEMYASNLGKTGILRAETFDKQHQIGGKRSDKWVMGGRFVLAADLGRIYIPDPEEEQDAGSV